MSRPRTVIRDLDPGYFALVMATGIVAVAADLAGWKLVARVLSIADVVAYAALLVATALRFILNGRAAALDLVDHRRGPGYFTFVAGSCVLGSQLLVLQGRVAVAQWLWLLAVCAWLLITYTFFAAVTVRHDKPALGDALGGSWLLAVVATQAVALLGAQLHQVTGWGGDELLFLCLCLFLLATVLYLLIIGVIFYRFTFLPLDAAHLSPPYWINMGALAITTLTGATLMPSVGSAPFWNEAHPFLFGFTLLFWAFGSWWIPLLVVFGVWRHLIARYPVRYASEYWGLVFPLGMYSVASYRLGGLVGLSVLPTLSRVFAGVAVAVWLATACGMVGTWVNRRSRAVG